MVRQTVKQLPWLDILIKKANEWGKKDKRAILRGRIKFLNRKGDTFDWDNEVLDKFEVVDTEPKLIKSDVIAKLS